jgi:hypothetical protein
MDADYLHHGDPVAFIGIVGFAAKHWYYLYCTAPGRDEQALSDVEAILASATIRKTVP